MHLHRLRAIRHCACHCGRCPLSCFFFCFGASTSGSNSCRFLAAARLLLDHTRRSRPKILWLVGGVMWILLGDRMETSQMPLLHTSSRNPPALPSNDKHEPPSFEVNGRSEASSIGPTSPAPLLTLSTVKQKIGEGEEKS